MGKISDIFIDKLSQYPMMNVDGTEVTPIRRVSASALFQISGFRIDREDISAPVGEEFMMSIMLSDAKVVGCVLKSNHFIWCGPTAFECARQSCLANPIPESHRIFYSSSLNYLEAVWNQYVKFRREQYE